jgi:hypothetical protein
MIELLLGHIAGDYLLQTGAMGQGKSKPGTEGTYWCTLHCTIYSACVAAFMIHGAGWRAAGMSEGDTFPSWALAWLIAFVNHYPIDRRSLGKTWMEWYGQDLEGKFAPSIYIAVDNGAHLILMYVWFKIVGA